MTAPDDLLPHLRALEESLFRPGVVRSAADFDRVLADGFIEFGSSGRVWTKAEILAEFTGVSSLQVTATEFALRVLGPDLAHLTYRTTRTSPDDAAPRHVLRSSLWQRIDGRWQMVFHQGTPTDA